MSKTKKWLAVVRDEHWTLAKVSLRKGELRILRMSELELAAPLLKSEARDGEETGPSVQLKAWLRQQKVPLKELKIAVSYFGVITRIIVLPKMSTKDLHKLLTEQTDQYFTLNIEDYVVDYRVIEHFFEEGQEKQKVLLAALPKSRWASFYETCLEAGFKPKTVDLASDSCIRLYANLSQRSAKQGKNGHPGAEDVYSDLSLTESVRMLNGDTDERDGGSDWAILDLSSGRVEFILLEKGRFFLFSDMELALESLTESLYDYKALRQREILPALPSEGLEDLEGQHLEILENQHEILKAGLEGALVPVLRTMGEFLNFFAARHFGKSIDQLFITGSYSDLPFLEELIRDNLGLKANIGFPNGWRPRFKKKARAYETQWMRYASLYGLAFRED